MKFITPTLKLKLKDKKSISFFSSKLNVEKGGSTNENLTSVLVDPNINLRIDPNSVYNTEFNFQIIIEGSTLKSFTNSIPDTKRNKDLKFQTLKKYLENYQTVLLNYSIQEAFDKVLNGDYNDYVDLTRFNNYYNFYKQTLNDDIFYFEITNQNNEVFGETKKIKPNNVDERYASELTVGMNDNTTTNIKEGFNVGDNIVIKYKNNYYNQSMIIYTSTSTAYNEGQLLINQLAFNNFDLNILNEG